MLNLKSLGGLCWALLVFGCLPAQEFTGGISLGGNTSQIDGDFQAGYRQFGLTAGGFVQYPLTNGLWLQPEILFDQLGARDQNALFNIRANYISIPVMLRAAIPIELDPGKPLPVHVEAGLIGGILLSARDAAFDRPLNDPFKRTDLRMAFSLDFRMGSKGSFNIRFARSFLSVFPNTGQPTFSLAGATGLFHRYVSFSFRYYLKPIEY